MPIGPFLVAPVRHLGESVGTIALGKAKSGQEFSGEFTREDEETLVMFASQAALIIANALRHWEALRVVDGPREPDQPPQDLLNCPTQRSRPPASCVPGVYWAANETI